MPPPLFYSPGAYAPYATRLDTPLVYNKIINEEYAGYLPLSTLNKLLLPRVPIPRKEYAWFHLICPKYLILFLAGNFKVSF